MTPRPPRDWLGVLIPKQYGGLGLALAEVAIVAEGLARELTPEPLTAAAALAGGALLGGDNESPKNELLPQLVAGEIDFDGVAVDVLSPFYYSRPATICGGSGEIQRNILAKYVLNLPS